MPSAHPTSTTAPGSSERSLIRAVGVWGLAASIVNVTVGGGIFGLSAAVAGTLGPAAPLAYLVCAVAMGLIVLCFAEAGSRVSLTGGPYAYVEVALGPYVGFMAGVMLWLLGCFAPAAVASLLVGAIDGLVGGRVGSGAGSVALLVLLFVFFAWINIRGIRQGTRLVEVATVAKLVPLVLLVAAGVFFIVPANLAIAHWPAGGALSRSSVVLIFAFMGIESALVPSGEVRDASRTVPRAIAIAMVGITLLYIVIQLVTQGILGPALAAMAAEKGPQPLAEAAGVAFGPWGRTLILVGAVVSMFGFVSGMTLAVPRALYAFARDGFLPAPLARIHPRFRTPYVAIAVQAAIICVLAATGSFAKLAVLANLAALLLYLACAIAAGVLRQRDVRQAGSAPFTLPGGWLVPVLAVVVILWLLRSITRAEWTVVGAVLAAATVVFLLTRARRRMVVRTVEG